MTDMSHIKHHGVKGMKWGVIRDKAASGSRSAQKKLAKADAKWESRRDTTAGFVEQNNALAARMNGPNGLIAKHNSNPKWSDKDLSDPKNAKLEKEYQATYEKTYRKTFEEVALDLYGESPSGKYTISFDWDAGRMVTTPIDKVEHNDERVAVIAMEFDTNRQLVNLKPEVDIEHFGVKGMKWGVIRSKGGAARSLSDDHVVSRQRKSKQLSELSTSELRSLNERLQLERTNRDLQSRGAIAKIKTGTAVAGTILAVGVTANQAIKFTKSPAGEMIRSLFTK